MTRRSFIKSVLVAAVAAVLAPLSATVATAKPSRKARCGYYETRWKSLEDHIRSLPPEQQAKIYERLPLVFGSLYATR